MDIKVRGRQVLSGEVYPSGSKNSAVHVIASSLLIGGKVVLENIPEITDVVRMFNILKKLGSKIDWNTQKGTAVIDNTSIFSNSLGSGDIGKMKGSSIFWGSLLGKFGKVDFDNLPGGCTLGIRPFEPIYQVLGDLGVKIKKKDCGVEMSVGKASDREVWLSEMSPTATTNAILVSVSLPANTKIIGAASEPQVQDVCNFLNKAGADITGIGSNVLYIKGGKKLKSVTFKLLSDHYEIATFLALGAVTGGEVRVHNAAPEHFTSINREFLKFGINITYEKDTAIVRKNQNIDIKGDFFDKSNIIRAQPWPALPVDLLPIFIPLSIASSSGYTTYHNWMYEAGLYWTSELTKLGAEIVMCDPHRVIVFGGRKLCGAELEAPYIIRAVVAMVMSAMIAEGESVVLNADALYRGHPNFSNNLKKLGAHIEEVV